MDFSDSLKETLQLYSDVRKQGARMGVVFFRHSKRDYRWLDLINTVTPGLKGTDIPMLDLGPALFENHLDEELFVYGRIDSHPNEIANRIAAQEILKFLQNEELLRLQ